MNKLTFFIIATFLLKFNANAQFAEYKVSEKIPKTKTTIDSKLYSINNGNTLFYLKEDINVIDAKTLEIKNTIDYPKFTKIDNQYINEKKFHDNNKDCVLEFDDYLLLLYKKLNEKKEIEVSYIKLKEDLKTPSETTKLFIKKNGSDIYFSINKKKNICVFYETVDNKKDNYRKHFYSVYDGELKLLDSDSIIETYDSKNNYSIRAYENGYYINKEIGLTNTTTVIDIYSKTSYTIDISDNQKKYYVTTIESFDKHQLILCGNFYYTNEDKSKTNGVYRFIYNQKSDEIVEKAYNELKIQGSIYNGEQNSIKNIENIVINENGDCYYLISQTVTGKEYNTTVQVSTKFELMYIGINDVIWTKQLPIVGFSWHFIDLFYKDNCIYLSYIDYENDWKKLDFNQYIYGKPMPSAGFSGASPNTSFLKISYKGVIEHQGIKDISSIFTTNFNHCFYGISRNNNGFTYNNCKLFKVSFN